MPGMINSLTCAAGRIIIKPVNAVSILMERLEKISESAGTRSHVSTFLVAAFILGLLSVELNTRGIIPAPFSKLVPSKHLVIIAQTFMILLCFEVISLVFSFVHSVSISMGKQIEIVSLVLLRDVFKEFSNFSEPIEWAAVKPFMFPMVSSAVGAFILFIILGYYYRIHKSHPITHDADETRNFIKIKRTISFLLLASFIIIIIFEGIQFLNTGKPNRAFETFYTILIFSDILIILVSMRYSSDFIITFRNSGFAVATVFMRMALMSPPPYSALIGVGSALFVVGLSMYYRHCTAANYCD